MPLMKPNLFLDGVMREVANKHNVSFVKVQECIAAQYEFTRKNIESFDSKTQVGSKVIYLPFFGKFIISDKIIGNLKEKYKDYKEKEDGE